MLGTLQKPALLEDIEAVLTRHFGQAANLRPGDLRSAVDEVELVVHYQPRLERKGGDWCVAGAEALVRWQHPTLGLIYPKDFLHLADDHSMTMAIADFVLTDAIRQIGHWRSRGLNLHVAVNLAPRLVKDLEFPDRLGRILSEFNVDASQLVLDVVEDAAQHDAELAMDIYTRLRVKGVGLALDDFGIGASSLTHLYKMPFSEVKIDHSLIGSLPQNRGAVTVVRAIVQLAHSFSLAACAEGVESALAFDLLDECGCDRVQGDFVGKPVPAGEFEAFLRAWNGAHTTPKAAAG
jgi:EAL domain-containing protein (putative c-di-GMP-specific phosphodiesterase class I)